MKSDCSRHSTLIYPQYNKSDSCISVNCPYYGVKNSEFVRIALGEKFTTSIGKEANATYTDWVDNLNKMISCVMINRCMMLGFLEYNLHRRKMNEEEQETTTTTTTQVKVCCGGVHTY